MTERGVFDMGDHMITRQTPGVASTRPKELVIKIMLPLVVSPGPDWDAWKERGDRRGEGRDGWHGPA
jgi:hypothetical protein